MEISLPNDDIIFILHNNIYISFIINTLLSVLKITSTDRISYNKNFEAQVNKLPIRQQIYWFTYIYIYIYILYIYMVEFSGEEVIVLPLVYCKPLHIWIEVSVAIERMYVNNSNCDS